MAISCTLSMRLGGESQALLARAREIGATLGESEARGRGMVHLVDCMDGLMGGDPWRYGQTAESALACFVAAEDRRYQVVAAAHVGMAQALLGDTAAAVSRLRATLVLCRELGEVVMDSVLRAHIALTLLESGAPEALEEAGTLAEVMATGGSVLSFWGALGYAALAGVRAAQGALEMAERAARRALASVAAIGPLAGAFLGRILLAQGRTEEAYTAVEEVLGRLEAEGRGSFMDIKLYLVAGEMRLAQGKDQAAHQALERAAELIEQRAARIGDADVRERYLHGVRDHVRVFELRRGG